LLWLPGRRTGHKDGNGFIHRERSIISCNAISQFAPQSRPPISTGHESKGMGMTEQLDRLAREREEITRRVASFKATQEKFEREREEYFSTTMENARNGFGRRQHWG
jgi:hypothetical protein